MMSIFRSLGFGITGLILASQLFAPAVLKSALYHFDGRGGKAVKAASGMTPGRLVQATIQLQPVLNSLSSPVYVTSARDGTNRLFIVELGGIIKVLQPGSSTLTVFLNITTRVLSGGERGLGFEISAPAPAPQRTQPDACDRRSHSA